MGDSIREQLLQSRAQALDAAGKPDGVRVHRSRATPLQNDQLPALVLYIADEATERQGGEWGPLVENQLLVTVEGRIQVPAGGIPDQLLDPLTTWATKVMVGDQTAGGFARKVERVQGRWDAKPLDKVYAAAGVHFLITYDSVGDDPEAQ